MKNVPNEYHDLASQLVSIDSWIFYSFQINYILTRICRFFFSFGICFGFWLIGKEEWLLTTQQFIEHTK